MISRCGPPTRYPASPSEGGRHVGSEPTTPRRRAVIPRVSSVNPLAAPLRSIVSTASSGFKSGSEVDNLDELFKLGDGPRRQGPKLNSSVYTSSDHSDSEKQARAYTKAPRHPNTGENAPAGTMHAASAEDIIMATVGPPISILREPSEFPARPSTL
jgi:hypothetical protein